MSRVLPVLFNTEMVWAVLDGRKTVTRRIVKRSVWEDFVCERGKAVNWLDKKTDILESPVHKAPCQIGDILYVRETWSAHYTADSDGELVYCYKADGTNLKSECLPGEWNRWYPSIHMPKEAARIWLKVTDVRVERLQSITDDDCMREGIRAWTKDGRMYKYYPADQEGDSPDCEWSECPRTPKEAMKRIWDSTIPKKQQALYGWSANPWVWVIEFERCGKPEADGT